MGSTMREIVILAWTCTAMKTFVEISPDMIDEVWMKFQNLWNEMRHILYWDIRPLL